MTKNSDSHCDSDTAKDAEKNYRTAIKKANDAGGYNIAAYSNLLDLYCKQKNESQKNNLIKEILDQPNLKSGLLYSKIGYTYADNKKSDAIECFKIAITNSYDETLPKKEKLEAVAPLWRKIAELEQIPENRTEHLNKALSAYQDLIVEYNFYDEYGIDPGYKAHKLGYFYKTVAKLFSSTHDKANNYKQAKAYYLNTLKIYKTNQNKTKLNSLSEEIKQLPEEIFNSSEKKEIEEEINQYISGLDPQQQQAIKLAQNLSSKIKTPQAALQEIATALASFAKIDPNIADSPIVVANELISTVCSYEQRQWGNYAIKQHLLQIAEVYILAALAKKDTSLCKLNDTTLGNLKRELTELNSVSDKDPIQSYIYQLEIIKLLTSSTLIKTAVVHTGKTVVFFHEETVILGLYALGALLNTPGDIKELKFGKPLQELSNILKEALGIRNSQGYNVLFESIGLVKEIQKIRKKHQILKILHHEDYINSIIKLKEQLTGLQKNLTKENNQYVCFEIIKLLAHVAQYSPDYALKRQALFIQDQSHVTLESYCIHSNNTIRAQAIKTCLLLVKSKNMQKNITLELEKKLQNIEDLEQNNYITELFDYSDEQFKYAMALQRELENMTGEPISQAKQFLDSYYCQGDNYYSLSNYATAATTYKMARNALLGNYIFDYDRSKKNSMYKQLAKLQIKLGRTHWANADSYHAQEYYILANKLFDLILKENHASLFEQMQKIKTDTNYPTEDFFTTFNKKIEKSEENFATKVRQAINQLYTKHENNYTNLAELLEDYAESMRNLARSIWSQSLFDKKGLDKAFNCMLLAMALLRLSKNYNNTAVEHYKHLDTKYIAELARFLLSQKNIQQAEDCSLTAFDEFYTANPQSPKDINKAYRALFRTCLANGDIKDPQASIDKKIKDKNENYDTVYNDIFDSDQRDSIYYSTTQDDKFQLGLLQKQKKSDLKKSLSNIFLYYKDEINEFYHKKQEEQNPPAYWDSAKCFTKSLVHHDLIWTNELGKDFYDKLLTLFEEEEDPDTNKPLFKDQTVLYAAMARYAKGDTSTALKTFTDFYKAFPHATDLIPHILRLQAESISNITDLHFRTTPTKKYSFQGAIQRMENQNRSVKFYVLLSGSGVGATNGARTFLKQYTNKYNYYDYAKIIHNIYDPQYTTKSFYQQILNDYYCSILLILKQIPDFDFFKQYYLETFEQIKTTKRFHVIVTGPIDDQWSKKTEELKIDLTCIKLFSNSKRKTITNLSELLSNSDDTTKMEVQIACAFINHEAIEVGVLRKIFPKLGDSPGIESVSLSEKELNIAKEELATNNYIGPETNTYWPIFMLKFIKKQFTQNPAQYEKYAEAIIDFTADINGGDFNNTMHKLILELKYQLGMYKFGRTGRRKTIEKYFEKNELINQCLLGAIYNCFRDYTKASETFSNSGDNTTLHIEDKLCNAINLANIKGEVNLDGFANEEKNLLSKWRENAIKIEIARAIGTIKEKEMDNLRKEYEQNANQHENNKKAKIDILIYIGNFYLDTYLNDKNNEEPYKIALSCFTGAKKLRIEEYGSEFHPEIVRAYNDLALTYYAHGNVIDAYINLEAALKLWIELYGKSDLGDEYINLDFINYHDPRINLDVLTILKDLYPIIFPNSEPINVKEIPDNYFTNHVFKEIHCNRRNISILANNLSAFFQQGSSNQNDSQSQTKKTP